MDQMPLFETDDPISMEGSATPQGGRGSITYKGDGYSVTPSGSFSSFKNKREFEDGVILNEQGKQVGLAVDGQVKLMEGVSLRGGLEKVFGQQKGDAYYGDQRVGGYNQKSNTSSQRLGATFGGLGMDYQKTTPSGGEPYENLSAVYKIKDTPDESLSVSGRTSTGMKPSFGLQYNKRFAEGGSVEQMNRLFQEGGMMQEGGTIDPVSGNEVPFGAMQEEVRDDIDAKLSEGEFVFPADVVRFIGLEKLMKIRDQAKQGLQRMEDMGQMGNAEEVGASPDEMFEDDDSFESDIDSIMGEVESESEETQQFAVGGLSGEDLTKASKNPMVDTRYFKHADGRVIYIVFVNGKPSVKIPEGFTPMEGPVEKQVGKEAEEDKKVKEQYLEGQEPSSSDPFDDTPLSIPEGGIPPEQAARNAKINDALTKTLPKMFVPLAFKAIISLFDKEGKAKAEQPTIGNTGVGIDSLGTPGLGGGRSEGAGLAFAESASADRGVTSYTGLSPEEIAIATDPDTSLSSDDGVMASDTEGSEAFSKGGLAGKKKKKPAPKQTAKSLVARK